jgi:hypothetical protein
MANKKKEISDLIETDDQPITPADVRNGVRNGVKNSLANQSSQTGQNSYEYTDRDQKDAERRSRLCE